MDKQDNESIELSLTTGQIRYLIDAMWGMTRHDSQAYAVRYDINDNALEEYLQTVLRHHTEQ